MLYFLATGLKIFVGFEYLRLIQPSSKKPFYKINLSWLTFKFYFIFLRAVTTAGKPIQVMRKFSRKSIAGLFRALINNP